MGGVGGGGGGGGEGGGRGANGHRQEVNTLVRLLCRGLVNWFQRGKQNFQE